MIKVGAVNAESRAEQIDSCSSSGCACRPERQEPIRAEPRRPSEKEDAEEEATQRK